MNDKTQDTSGVSTQRPPEDTIGDRIKTKRADLGLNFEELSRLCKEYDAAGDGIAPNTLLRYESGKFKPGARELRILCDTLDVSANWLLLGEGDGHGGRASHLTLSEGLDFLKGMIDEVGRRVYSERYQAWDLGVRQEKIQRAKKRSEDS